MTGEEISRILAKVGERQEAAVDWSVYRTCGTCKAGTGKACRALNGRVAGGRPDGVATELPHAHAHRRRRAGR